MNIVSQLTSTAAGRRARRPGPGRPGLWAGVVAAALVVAGTSSSARAQTPAWSVVPSPNRERSSALQSAEFRHCPVDGLTFAFKSSRSRFTRSSRSRSASLASVAGSMVAAN